MRWGEEVRVQYPDGCSSGWEVAIRLERRAGGVVGCVDYVDSRAVWPTVRPDGAEVLRVICQRAGGYSVTTGVAEIEP